MNSPRDRTHLTDNRVEHLAPEEVTGYRHLAVNKPDRGIVRILDWSRVRLELAVEELVECLCTQQCSDTTSVEIDGEMANIRTERV